MSILPREQQVNQRCLWRDNRQGRNVEENWRFHEAVLVFCQRPPADVALVPDTLQKDMGDTLNGAKAGENR